MQNNLIASEFSLALRAGLSDQELLRIVQSGSGGWLRGIAKRVEAGRLPQEVAVRLILQRAEDAAFSSKVPVSVLFIIGLWIKALRGIHGTVH